MRRFDSDDERGMIEVHHGGGGAKTFLIGLALGAAVALLFAPQSGEQTRKDIRKNALRARKRAARFAEDVADDVVNRFDDARGFVEEGVVAAKSAVERKRRQAADAMDAGREAARSTRSKLEHRIAETKAAFEAGSDIVRGNGDR